MAVTDDERRLVAERLRGLGYSGLQESLICAYLDALGIKGYEGWIGIAHRLADLTEPAPTSSDTAPTCDREALLAMADKIEASARHLNVWQGPFLNANDVRVFARRIREACGEAVE